MSLETAKTNQPRTPRQGPRPLPFHLLSQASMLFSSLAVLPSWRNGSFVRKPQLREAAERLKHDIDGIGEKDFDRALRAESTRRVEAFLTGIEAYRQHPYQRDLPVPPTIWQEGTTRLLDYGLPGSTGLPVLVVPSLVNRAYILDLSRKRSLLRTMAARGLRPYLVDWDAPGSTEQTFTLESYVAGRLGRVLDEVLARSGRRPAVLGYCMGGLLGLGLAVLRQDDVSGLVALATPWDFHQPNAEQGQMVASLRPVLEDVLTLFGQFPVDLLQTLFTTIDPGGIERKFRTFGRMKTQSAKARDFVTLEDWLNDGVALTAGVARECLFGWYVDNLPVRGAWHLANTPILPQNFYKPALALIPSKDRIVPPPSALALAERLGNGKGLVVETGHIGMVSGARATSEVYGVLIKWLKKLEKM